VFGSEIEKISEEIGSLKVMNSGSFFNWKWED